MSTWNSRGLRGSTLETMINVSIEMYREKHLALIQKIPTPIKPINMDKENRQITLAYFDQKSTVDYIGLVQGVPVCFDAKECAVDTIPLHNIHEHQYKFMKEFEEQGGISFIILPSLPGVPRCGILCTPVGFFFCRSLHAIRNRLRLNHPIMSSKCTCVFFGSCLRFHFISCGTFAACKNHHYN